jgi:hypothetical protein
VANLYAQTAAEYRACCLQIYECAERRLEAIWQAKQLTFRKLAVVMDLEETVLDTPCESCFLELSILWDFHFSGRQRLLWSQRIFDLQFSNFRFILFVFDSDKFLNNYNSSEAGLNGEFH